MSDIQPTGVCECIPHPCENMHCDDQPEQPFLDYAYDKHGNLDCFCRKPCFDGVCGGPRKPPQCVETICAHPDHDIVEYDPERIDDPLTMKGCICVQNPCETLGYKCEHEEHTVLAFSYSPKGELECFCRRDPCAEERCEHEEYKHLHLDQDGNCWCTLGHEEL